MPPQLEAYKARHVDALLAACWTDAGHWTLHRELLTHDHEQPRSRLPARFEEPNLHATPLPRIVVGNLVADAGQITRDFAQGRGTLEMLCMDELADGRFPRAWLARGETLLGLTLISRTRRTGFSLRHLTLAQ